MAANYTIQWEATTAGTTGTGLGQFVVFNGTDYIPAVTANLATYSIVRGVLISAVSNGIAAIQYSGDVDESILGITWDPTKPKVILNKTTGYAQTAASVGISDIELGRFDSSGHLQISLAVATSTATSIPAVIYADSYGCVGDGVTDDTAAIQAMIDAIPSLGKGVIRGSVGQTFKITSPLNVYETTAAGQRWRLTLAGSSYSYGASQDATASLVWSGTEKSGAAAAIASKAAFAAPHPQTFFATAYFVTITGLSGITSADLGKRLALTGTAGALADGEFPIVSIVSSTSVKVMSVTAVVAPNANNGSIAWRVCETMLHWHTRESSLEDLSFYATTNVWSAIDFNRANGAGSVQGTWNHYKRIVINGNTGKINIGHQTGGTYVPVVGDYYYALDSGLPIPYDAYQLDYQTFEDCLFYGLGLAGYYCTNNARQSRSNEIKKCYVGTSPYGFLQRGWDLGAAAASMHIDFYGVTFGNITNTCMKLTQAANSQPMVVNGFYAESCSRMLDADWGDGSVTSYPITFVGGGFHTGEAYCAADGIIVQIHTGPVVFNGFRFNFAESTSTKPVQIHLTGNHAEAMFLGCCLLNPADFGITNFFTTDSVCRVIEQGCVQTNAGTTHSARVDRVWSFYGDTGKVNLNTVQGLSGTQTAALSFAKVVSVNHGGVTGTWTFAQNEPDTNYEIIATATGGTGGPAAGSETIVSVAKNVGSAVLTVKTDPGGAAVQKFICMLVRP